jgi:asparagine synthase (glutamine-hydrolysing)
MFENYKNLCSRTYYYETANQQNLARSINDILKTKHDQVNRVDPVSVLSIIMKNYIIGNRTLVQGINRSPWLAKQKENGEWESAKLCKHKNEVYETTEIAKELKERLIKEALVFLQNKTQIGILLSGGMDSRIIAGIIKQLQNDKLFDGKVIAVTWGIPESRDAIYAKTIAKQFKWDYEFIPLTSELLYDNILLAAECGAEFSPIHLHAMKKVSEIQGLDGVIAGSYGDSIGRGEYSGKKINKLSHILSKHLNHFSFLIHSIEKSAIKKIRTDLYESRSRFPDRSEFEYREIEMQMHYMHRQLNSCMCIIDDSIPLYQMFTAPDVYGYIWSLHPKCRNDDIYFHLLSMLPGNLVQIPWARTGAKYNCNSSMQKDKYSSLNNKYGAWLRNDCRTFICEKISCGILQKLGIFNPKSLSTWLKYWPKSDNPRADRLDEKLAWLASLAIFIEKYDIKGISEPVTVTAFDSLLLLKSIFHTLLYQKASELLK